MKTGYIDSVTSELVTGWAQEDGEPATVVLLVNGTVQASLQVTAYRHDLVAAGFKGEAGFVFDIAEFVKAGDTVGVSFASGEALNGSPKQVLDQPSASEAETSCPIFLHIPKTGGSAVYELVCGQSPDHAAMNSATIHADIARMRSNAAKPSLIFGHLSYGAHSLLDVKPDYITLLRNPVDRIVSCYRYNRSIPWSPYRGTHAFDASLKDFVESCTTEETNNHMCRIIAGVSNREGMHITKPWLLEMAIANMEKDFSLVGRSCQMTKFVTELAGKLGWDEVPEIGDVNVTRGDALSLDRETLSTITAHNSLDIDLFAYVASRYG